MRLRAFRIGLTGALGVGVGLLVWSAVSSLAALLTYVGLACFAALGVEPVIRSLARWLPRPAAVAVVFILLLAVLAAVLSWVIPVLIREAGDLVQAVPAFISSVSASAWFRMTEAQLDDFVDLGAATEQLSAFLSRPRNLALVGGGVLSFGVGLAETVTGAVLVLILTLYFSFSLGASKAALYQLVPASRRAPFASIAEDISDAISRYIAGQFLLSLINGILTGVFLTAINAPSPLLLALVAFLGSAIPLVGTIASSVIIIGVCLLASPVTAVVAAVYYLIYMQIEAYLLTPRIMDKMVKVPGPLVVIAVVAGGTLGGIIGALVAVPVAAAAVIVLRKVVIPKQNQR
ncbi:AI-2E family transporter [Arthrobacter zhaoguopingii]|uniref:AI-2E family transporter n=1 Tax=Arthrobacter zhaoguopingii TaxID=2681491 RepID=UPI001FE3FD33|nr:AI-2E family transporter [Arthrobacter zhaoguopingii]